MLEISHSILVSFPTIYLALIGAEKSVTEIFIEEKEKWTKKGNDKQEEIDSLSHNTSRP